MRSEREKITGKVAAATLRLNANRHELLPDEDTCYLLLVSTWDSGHQLVVTPDTTHCIVDSREDHHWVVVLHAVDLNDLISSPK